MSNNVLEKLYTLSLLKINKAYLNITQQRQKNATYRLKPDIDSIRTSTKILGMESWCSFFNISWSPNSMLVLAEVQRVIGIFSWNC